MKETKLTREYTVTEDMLAVNFGSGSVRVLATPKVAAFFEGTAAELVQKPSVPLLPLNILPPPPSAVR